MTIPSLFVERDPNKHMSINLDTGLWQCFKSGERGNFLKLFSQLENITYRVAYQKFLVDEFFQQDENKVSEDVDNPEYSQEQIKDCFADFKKVDVTNVTSELNSKAIMALIERGILDRNDFYVAETGFYKGRLIIPYRNKDKVFYFQGRTLSNQQPKYLNFKGMKSSVVLYPFDYGSTNPLYVCEGAIDAISLQMLGLNATTTISCHVSLAQIEQLKYYQGKIVVAYDNDRAGHDGLRAFDLRRRRARMKPISYCFPAVGFKDWNEMFVKDPELALKTTQSHREFNLNEWDICCDLKNID